MWSLLVSAQSADVLPIVDNFVVGKNLAFGLSILHYNPYEPGTDVFATRKLKEPPTLIFSLQDPGRERFVCDQKREAFSYIAAFQMSPREVYENLLSQGMVETKKKAHETFVDTAEQAKVANAA